MPAKRLDHVLLAKIVGKAKKNVQYVREQISKKAGRLGVSSPAAQIIWAQELGISTTRALNKASADVRSEVRSGAGNTPAPHSSAKREKIHRKRAQPIDGAAIDALLQDSDLRGRCRDLLLANKHFDRAIREATTVLDDRLKANTGIRNMLPASLVGAALNPDPRQAVIIVSQDKAEQEGFHAMCKGVMLAFRNQSHHTLSNKLSRADALKICGFVDTLLGAIEKAEVHTDRIRSK